MKKYLTTALVAWAVTAVEAQLVELTSGSIHVQAGTTMVLHGPLDLLIHPGASVSNDGVIDLGDQATISEPSGAPIRGAGVEKASTGSAGPFSSVEPGRLGLAVTTNEVATLQVVRGHSPMTLPEGDIGIQRWFMLNGPDATSPADLSLRYDETELNGLSASSLGLFRSVGMDGPWSLVGGTNDAAAFTVTGTLSAPWAYITAFDSDAPTASPSLHALEDLHVWPTLTNDNIFILSKTGSPIGTIQLIDGMGRTIHSDAGSMNSTLKVLDLSGIASGAYFLRAGQRPVIKLRKE